MTDTQISQGAERDDSRVRNLPEGGFRERLERLGDSIDALRAQLEDEIELRDQLVADALEERTPVRTVARWARISRTRALQVRVARLVALEGLEG